MVAFFLIAINVEHLVPGDNCAIGSINGRRLTPDQRSKIANLVQSSLAKSPLPGGDGAAGDGPTG